MISRMRGICSFCLMVFIYVMVGVFRRSGLFVGLSSWSYECWFSVFCLYALQVQLCVLYYIIVMFLSFSVVWAMTQASCEIRLDKQPGLEHDGPLLQF